MAKKIKDTRYIECNGKTADSVYVTTIDGDEIGSFQGCDWTDALIHKLEAKYGVICATFQGGDLDGFEAI